MGQFAWVTLATNDSYALGAMVVAFSLKKANTVHQLAVLITPGVTSAMRDKLQTIFNVVEEVNVLDSKDAANLALLSRPELGITFTKLHCWRLTQFEKCVFLDADTFILRNCDELFDREELSAAPDVGWPDCFNSGVFVYRPSVDTFEKLTQFAVQKGSFDGGDQGLLNSYFANWAAADSSKRLPFVYNTCSTACYSYLPAFKQFGDNVKILHFIGQLKPWVINFDPVTKKANPPQEYKHLSEYLDLWWNLFCAEAHPKLTTEMGGLAGALAGLRLGQARTAEQEAYENNCRRHCWEHGSIDYLGKDSFDNIWKQISQTLESKNGSSSTTSERRARTPTPQPEDKLPKDAKKEGTAHEQVINEVTSDGRQIQKKIVTIPGREREVVEEWESTQIGDKKTEKHTKRSMPSKPSATVPATKPSKAAEAALKELVAQEIVIVPGHTKVEFDEKTNTKTVTEKTTTGYQVTITTVSPEGRTKIQTKTYYDPIAVPVDPEEEIEEEEEETVEESWEPTSTTKKTQQQQQVKTTQQDTSIQSKNVHDQKQTQVQNTSDQTKLQQNKKVTQEQHHQQQQQQTTVTQQRTTKTVESHQVQQSSSTKTNQSQQQTIQQQNTQNTQNTQIVQKNNDRQVAVPSSGEPRTIVVKKKLDTGEEIEIHTTISADGLSKSCRRIVTKPAEELEITDYQETNTYEPGEVKIRTTTKTYPSGETTEQTTVSQQSSTKKVTETRTQQQHQQQHHHHSIDEQRHHQQNVNQQHQSIKNQTDVTETQKNKQLKNVDQQNQNVVSNIDQNQEFVAAQHSTRRTKVTESVTMIVQDESGTSGATKTKQVITKDQKISTGQSGQKPVSNQQNQTEVNEEEHILTQEQIQQLLQQQNINQTTNKQITDQTQTKLTQEQIEQLKRIQEQQSHQKTTTKQTNVQQTTQHTSQQQQHTTQQHQKKLTQEQIDRQGVEMRKQLEDQKSQKQVSDQFTKRQHETIKKETHTITSQTTRTFTTTTGHTVTRPETLPGEQTTEEVRYFPGGVEYTWRTVRSDGSSKMSQRIFYDPVPVGIEEEEEETTEEYSGPVTMSKKKLPVAPVSKMDHQSGKQI